MAFYLRKAFKTGPIRLNLSKGGLGISGGVTGARVGINSRGTYVHGGRYGLYYRKYARKGIKKGKGRAGAAVRGGSGSSRHPHGERNSGPVDLFVDTGVTLGSDSAGKRKLSRPAPDLPGMSILNTPLNLVLIFVIFLFFFSLISQYAVLMIGTAAVAVAVPGWIFREFWWRSKVNESLDHTITHLEKHKTLPDIPLLKQSSLPDSWRERFSLNLHATAAELAMRNEDIDTLAVLRELDDKVPADTNQTSRFRATIFGEILDEFLEDHLLSEEEESAIRRLMEQLNLPDELMRAELDRIGYFAEVRRQMEQPLEPVDPGISLLRGENTYAVFENARLLNERVLNRYQRDNVQYRELGYEIDMEGRLLLTDRRLLFIDRGSREYRLNRVLHLTVDPEAGTTELTLDNRKSPVIISTKKPLVFAAKVEKVMAIDET